MHPLLVFLLLFMPVTLAASIVTRSQTHPLHNSVGPVTNLTISNAMIAPDGFLRSYAVLG